MRAGCGHVAKPCGHGVASGMSTRYGGNSVAPAAGSWQRHGGRWLRGVSCLRAGGCNATVAGVVGWVLSAGGCEES